MLNRGVTLNFWPKGSEVKTVLKNYLLAAKSGLSRWTLLKHTHKVYSYFILESNEPAKTI